jgi:DNA-binding SARP family transcriptional activator
MAATNPPLAARQASSISVHLLQSFEIRVDGVEISLPYPARRVVAFLAVNARRQERGRVAFMLWTSAPEARARANLRRALWQLNQLSLVDAFGSRLGIDPAALVDVHELVKRAKQVIGHTHGDHLDDDVTVSDFIDDLLPDWDEDWIHFERERLRQLRLHALEALSIQLTSAGRHAEAVDAAHAAVTAEPLRESAQTALIRAHLAENNLAEARRAFESYQSLLWDSLGYRPGDHLQELMFRDRASASLGGGLTR